ncbi:hypothetical protein AB5I41_06600 [Sphingomonas sp. MMS24-JH45]
MSPLRRQWRQTLTIARRDFVATVFTPILPAVPLRRPPALLRLIGGMGAASVSVRGRPTGSGWCSSSIAPTPRRCARRTSALRSLFSQEQRPPVLEPRVPAADPARQARAALEETGVDVAATIRGPLAHPTIAYAACNRRADARYLAALADRALLAQASGATLRAVARIERVTTGGPTLGGRSASAFMAVFGIFFLTLFLSGQVVGTMAEERNNKVIEALAAAVPLELVFLGKLLGMFGGGAVRRFLGHGGEPGGAVDPRRVRQRAAPGGARGRLRLVRLPVRRLFHHCLSPPRLASSALKVNDAIDVPHHDPAGRDVRARQCGGIEAGHAGDGGGGLPPLLAVRDGGHAANAPES